jgi:hypothetical protein
MAIFSDGTQVFGIAASPLTINSITYIAEDIKVTKATRRVAINNPDGTPLGATYIPEAFTMTAKLQLASSSTAIPTNGLTATVETIVYYLQSVGEVYTQGAYSYVDITCTQKLN